MNLVRRYRVASVALSLMTIACTHTAHAQIAFESPAEQSSLSKSTILRGSCTGSKNVVLNGPGIARNKTVSCQKADKHANFWSYALTNTYKDMPDGGLLVTAAQG